MIRWTFIFSPDDKPYRFETDSPVDDERVAACLNLGTATWVRVTGAITDSDTGASALGEVYLNPEFIKVALRQIVEPEAKEIAPAERHIKGAHEPTPVAEEHAKAFPDERIPS